MSRLHPQKALKVAQLRCEAAVTITISGKAGSGKSTAAEIIGNALYHHGLNAALIESDDSIRTLPLKEYPTKGDDRPFLVIVEDSEIQFKPRETAKPEQAEEKQGCDGDCKDCGDEIPPILKAMLAASILKAAKMGM